jgi:hypothetical protein
MRRLMYFLLLVLVVGTSATCVRASTDCERWFASYRSELLHTQQVQRIAAAKRRARLYAQRKLAGYVKPKPTVVHPHGPRMSRPATLRHFDLACGVLPESSADQPLIAEEEPAPLGPEVPEDEVGLLPGFDGPGTILPEDGPTPPSFAQSPPTGGPPIYTPPYTTPGGGYTTPPTPPITPVPEPGSYVLILTGLAGAASVIRRRWKA